MTYSQIRSKKIKKILPEKNLLKIYHYIDYLTFYLNFECVFKFFFPQSLWLW